MRPNEEEISSVPDTASKAVQKLQKAKNKPLIQKNTRFDSTFFFYISTYPGEESAFSA
jgi:hypothetical protein